MKNERKIIEEILKLINFSKALQVRKQCVELVPHLIKHLREFDSDETLFDKAIKSIFSFMGKKEKDKKDDNIKGVGFISLGKISLLAKQKTLEPYIDRIFDLIDAEIKKPAIRINKDQYHKPIRNTDVLLCIRDLAKNYGHIFERRYSARNPMTPGTINHS
mmetsp:Transcript_20798/g.32062  ORF Transcript_20798/g.32062 Transcript_20798/m.32062 type:complete len:161 (+) Transcript_20798:1066-1548(+)